MNWGFLLFRACVAMFIGCFVTITLHAQSDEQPTPWQTQSPLPAPNVIRKIAFINEQTGWAVGRDTLLLKTSNGGLSWEVVRQNVLPRNLFLTIQFSDVRMVSENIIWAVANAGVIRSNDGGKTWQRLADGGTSIAVRGERHAWIASDDLSNGIVRRSNDAGQTWQTVQIPGIRPRDIFFLDTARGWVAGADGIAATSDGGATWTQLVIASSSALTGSKRFTTIHFINQQIGVAGAEDSTLIVTADGGQTWQRASMGVAPFDDIVRVQMVSAMRGYALTDANAILSTADGGLSWQEQSRIPTTTFALDMQFLSEQHGYVAGGIYFNLEESSIWRTLDAGRSWQQIRGTKNMPLYGIAARSQNDITAVGNTTILTTNNSGRLWATQLPLPGNPDNFAKLYRSVAFVRPQRGYIAGEAGRILRTSDGGASWQQPMAQRSGNNWYGIGFANDSVGWVVGASSAAINPQPIVWKTSNSGQTWESQTLPRTTLIQDTLHSVAVVNDRVVYAVGNQGAIYATKNGGTTWVQQSSPTRSNLYGVFFLNESTGWAVGGASESAVIVHTSDGGTTWRRQLAPADNPLKSVYFSSSQRGYAVGNGGTTLATRNGGTTWEVQDSRTIMDLHSLVFVTPVRGFIVGARGTILSTNNGGFTPEVRTSATEIQFGTVSVRDEASRTLTISGEHLLEPLMLHAPEGVVLDYAGSMGLPYIQLSPDSLATTQATIKIRFQPRTDGVFSGALQISSAYIQSTVALSGRGINRPVLRFSIQQLDFGDVRVGEMREEILQVTNIGTTAGTLSYSILPADTTQNPIFGVPVFVRSTEIRPEERLPVPVRFQPRTFGEAEAIIVVRVQAGAFDTTYTVRCRGRGLQAVLQPSAQMVEFGSVSISHETRATFGITNIGNIAATVRDAIIEPVGAFVLLTPFQELRNARILPGDSFIMPIQLTPQSLGFTRATLVLNTDTGILRIPLLGNGVPLLTTPQLVAPFNGRINTPVSPVFLWRGTDDALIYDVQIARDSSFSRLAVERSGVRSFAFSPTTDLEYNTLYFWRVKARTPTLASDWSQVWSFETARSGQRLRSNPEPVQISGYLGEVQRGMFTVRSIARTTITRAFWQAGTDSAFSLRQDQFPFELRPNLTEFITFDFHPRNNISSDIRGVLVLVSPIDTHKVQIIGESLERDGNTLFTKVVVQTDRSSVSPGDTINIRIVLSESQNLDLERNRNKAQSFSALLKIRNETVLAAAPTLTFPTDLSNNVFLGNGGKTIELRDIPRDAQTTKGILAEIPALALLGNATSTVVEFLSFQWNDAVEQRIVQSVVDSSVAFVHCEAGGTRLIKFRDGNALSVLSPNPVAQSLTVKMNLLENGTTALYLVNVLGQRVRTFFDTEKGWGEYVESLDISGLPDGAYTLVLQTPSSILHQRIGVIK